MWKYISPPKTVGQMHPWCHFTDYSEVTPMIILGFWVPLWGLHGQFFPLNIINTAWNNCCINYHDHSGTVADQRHENILTRPQTWEVQMLCILRRHLLFCQGEEMHSVNWFLRKEHQWSHPSSPSLWNCICSLHNWAWCYPAARRKHNRHVLQWPPIRRITAKLNLSQDLNSTVLSHYEYHCLLLWLHVIAQQHDRKCACSLH